MASKRFVRNNKPAIAYYRSSAAACAAASIEQQRRQAHEYAEKHGYEIVREYQDSPCLSGRDSFHGLQQMLAEVSEIRPTILIEWSADRISRDPSTVEVTKKSLRDAGCGVEYIAGGSREDTPEGRLIESFFDGLEGAASAQ